VVRCHQCPRRDHRRVAASLLGKPRLTKDIVPLYGGAIDIDLSLGALPCEYEVIDRSSMIDVSSGVLSWKCRRSMRLWRTCSGIGSADTA
jgi:hypothetical protein